MGMSTVRYEDVVAESLFFGEDVFPKWAKELSERYEGVSAVDFYDDIFMNDLAESRVPEEYITGEYCGIAIEKIKLIDEDGKPILDDKGNEKWRGRRTQITKGNKELYSLIDRSENFCLIAPMSYAGRCRKNEHARFMYAFCIEIDNIVEGSGLKELIYSWERDYHPVPKPTYIVCSGGGIHLYFAFERPVPMWKNVFEAMKIYKTYMTPRYWTKFVTTDYEKIQYESVNQPFRIVGTRTKDGGLVMAFRVGPKVTIEYMNRFAPADKAMTCVYKAKHTKAEAKELYPDWYKRRIEEGQPRGKWDRHPGIYYNWIEKILDPVSGAEVGRRYNCLENLCSLAVQCNIPPEQVEADCHRIAERLELLTVDENNHFTEYDVLCALKTYHHPKEQAWRRRTEFISKKTGIPLTPNKRNGRKQADHLKRVRALQVVDYPEGEWRRGNGRPKKAKLVQKWRAAHPDGKKEDCHRETGMSRDTIRKWWNYKEIQ